MVIPTWSVCSTVSEPKELLAAFVCHHLALGAEEVHLFLDHPNDDTVEFLSHIDGLKLTLCTKEYWQNEHGKRPPVHLGRQKQNANWAYKRCNSDWFFFCDADEYFAPNVSVGELLKAIPSDEAFKTIRVAERFFTGDALRGSIFDGAFRRAFTARQSRELLPAIYGDLSNMMNCGLTGHKAGKSFIRTGGDVEVRIHIPVVAGYSSSGTRNAQYFDDSWLVHYDGLTQLHWQLKMLREYERVQKRLRDAKPINVNSARHQQLMAVYEGREQADILEKLLPLSKLNDDQYQRLKDAGGIVEININPSKAAQSIFDNDLDFSIEAFNQKLLNTNRHVFEKYGLLETSLLHLKSPTIL